MGTGFVKHPEALARALLERGVGLVKLTTMSEAELVDDLGVPPRKAVKLKRAAKEVQV